MAVYKVIQDVESEDKLIGFLSLKGLIYAGIAATCAFINLKLVLTGGAISYVFVFIFAMPMILFGVLASPLGREQPTEVWLLSRIRFFLKPRQRIWDQSGTMDLVTVTVPKKQELHLTKDLSQDEVHSRLRTLAVTLDTRGWAVKNVDVNLSVPEVQSHGEAESDRLVGTAGMPQQMPVVDVHAADDIMDEKSNPTAQKFEAMMKQAEEERRHTVLATMRGLVEDSGSKKPEPKKSHHKVKHAKKKEKTVPKEEQQTFDENLKRNIEKYARETAAERARRRAEEDARIAQELVKARQEFNSEFESGHHKPNPHHRMFGAVERPAAPAPAPTPTASVPNPVTAARQADNMELAQSGSAFSVSTLSQLANRPNIQQTGPDEVTISLH